MSVRLTMLQTLEVPLLLNFQLELYELALPSYSNTSYYILGSTPHTKSQVIQIIQNLYKLSK